MIASIAWKNIWRNKVRSMVVVMATILGLVGGTFAGAFMYGMVEQRLRASIEKEVSHIQVHNPSWPDNKEMQCSIPGGDSLAESLGRMEGVKAATARSRVPGMIVSANASSGIEIIAMDPEKEKQVTSVYRNICDSCGSWFADTRKNQVVMGKKLADKLKVRLRSKVVLRFQDAEGNLVESAFKIVGLYRTSNSMFDEQMVFIRSTDMSALLGSPAPVHEIALLLSDPSKVVQVRDRIRAANPALLVQDWAEVSPELGLIVGVTDQMTYIFLGIILLALAFGIVNTMLMAVLERTREIGMLMSVGMSRGRVFRMIMLETIWLTSTGGVFGMILSYGLIRLTNHTGINLSVVATGLEALGYEAIVYPSISLGFYFVLSAMILVTGVLSSIYPARKALKIVPAEAIKME